MKSEIFSSFLTQFPWRRLRTGVCVRYRTSLSARTSIIYTHTHTHQHTQHTHTAHAHTHTHTHTQHTHTRSTHTRMQHTHTHTRTPLCYRKHNCLVMSCTSSSCCHRHDRYIVSWWFASAGL